jgi:3-methyl-2-oxobutanoate hydroxymethyltransferase
MYTSKSEVAPARRKVSAPDVVQRKGGKRLTMVTAYDYTMARLVDAADIDMVLVGDSLGMIVQGHSTTLPVTLDEMVYHCRAVARGLTAAHLVGDLPFLTYQSSAIQALESAGRLMKDGACESVKLEGGAVVAEGVAKIVSAGIPVVGHIGLTPQSVHALGGFRVQGRGDSAAYKLLDDAKILQDAGVFCLVLEAIPPDVAAEITAMLAIPTIGIGAGPDCDGQVLVCTDLLGMSQGHRPKFVRKFAELGDAAIAGFNAFAQEVQQGTFPAAAETYKPNRDARDESAPQLRIAASR